MLQANIPLETPKAEQTQIPQGSVLELAEAIRAFALHLADLYSNFNPYKKRLEFLKDWGALSQLLKGVVSPDIKDKITILINELTKNWGSGTLLNAQADLKVSINALYENFQILQKEVYAKRDAVLKTDNEFILPPEILELVYIQGLLTCSSEAEAKEFYDNFKQVSDVHKTIAERKLVEDLYKCLFNANVTKQTLDQYFSDKNTSPEVIQFFFEHLRLDPNHYIVSYYPHLYPKIFYSLEALLKIDGDNSREPDSRSRLEGYQGDPHLGDTIRAQPLFFLAIKYNREDVLNLFEVDFSLSAYRRVTRTNQREWNPHRHFCLDREQPISAFQYAILKGFPEMLEYFSPGLALRQPESSRFLTFAVKNKAPVASIDWLLDRGVALDPTELGLRDIIGNGHIRLLEAFSRQKNFNVNSFGSPNSEISPLSVALAQKKFAIAVALIGLGAKLIEGEAITEASMIDQEYINILMRILTAERINPDEVTRKLIPAITSLATLQFAFKTLDFKKNPDAAGNQFFHFFAQSNLFCRFFSEILEEKHPFWGPSYQQALSISNYEGQTPIHFFFLGLSDLENMHELSGFNSEETLHAKLLCATDNRGRTGVHYLFDKENLVLSQESLLEDDGSLSGVGNYILKFLYTQDDEGRTPLHIAAMKWGKNTQSLAGFKVLVETLKPELNSPLTHAGESILILAAKNKNRELVKYLLNLLEVDIRIKDGSGKTAMDYVVDDPELRAAFRRAAIADLENKNVPAYKGSFFEVLTHHIPPDSSLNQLKN